MAPFTCMQFSQAAKTHVLWLSWVPWGEIWVCNCIPRCYFSLEKYLSTSPDICKLWNSRGRQHIQLAQPVGTIPVKNEKYVKNICTHTLSAAKGRPPGPLLNEGPVTPVAHKSTLCKFERGLRSAVGLLSWGESQGTRERKERADGGHDGCNKRLRLVICLSVS